MSYQLSEAEVKQYEGNVIHLAQQKGSRTRGTARLKSGIVGEAYFFERIGATDAVEITSIHQDTPLIDVPHSKRRISPKLWAWATLIDEEQKLRTLIDPTSEYALNAAYAMGRKMDDLIITALRGTAYSGKDGATSVVLPAGQKIATGGVGMTIAKLTQAKRILDLVDFDPDEPRYILVGAKQLEDLLGTTQITSSDYNTVKALVQGQIDTFLGFKFILTNRLVKSGTDRYCLAYVGGDRGGVGLGVWKDVESRVDVLPQKNYATQVYSKFYMDATRTQDEGVVEIACQE